ncbi:hypothetical protein L914_13886 [Phytophthora nicotianae]|uniref:Uncharacterized protein n=2 Tax=Phytophthora nicotianae TaxID=4792 RepID=V9EMH7_PHYNI|nr:hypothetical protein F443_14426 [Phytophthora nicotianae P1569]ETL33613.1 hypothetical protein L916_13966 [Phytophthora nicotianae]ETM40062.1 hypothetical protein L914_13886 [Phytophthora nicotianae]
MVLHQDYDDEPQAFKATLSFVEAFRLGETEDEAEEQSLLDDQHKLEAKPLCTEITPNKTQTRGRSER